MLRVRVPQLVLVLVAGYELRGLLGALPHVAGLMAGVGSPGSLGLAGLAMVLGAGLLTQVGRGLSQVARTPRWTLALIGLWLMFCSALLVLCASAGAAAAHGALGHLLPNSAPWAAAVSSLALGVGGVAVALTGAVWLLGRRVDATLAAPAPAGRDPVTRRWISGATSPPASPLLAGWSLRGPPACTSIPTI